MTETIVTTASIYVSALKELHENAPTIDLNRRGSGPRQQGEFDPNSYLDALPHLSLQRGYTLDFYYMTLDGMDGEPWVYARKLTDDPLLSRPVDKRGWPQKGPLGFEPIEYLILDGSPDSWFELVVFQLLAGQFYLCWHAGYNDNRFVTNSSEATEILDKIRLPPELRERAQKLDPCVYVNRTETYTQVTYLVFSDWGGFKRLRASFMRDRPYIHNDPVLIEHIPYNCGICY